MKGCGKRDGHWGMGDKSSIPWSLWGSGLRASLMTAVSIQGFERAWETDRRRRGWGVPRAFAWRLYSHSVAPSRFLGYDEAVAVDGRRIGGRRHDIAFGGRCKEVARVDSEGEGKQLSFKKSKQRRGG